MSVCSVLVGDANGKRVRVKAVVRSHVLLSSVNGAMERSSSLYRSEAQSRVFCLFNIEAPLVTSWTEENLGRHFYGCGAYKDTQAGKGWHDPVGNICQKKIIVALMKEVDDLKFREKGLQSRISDMKMKEKFIGIVLVVCWGEERLAYSKEKASVA
ncbi:hypothetical protein HKD37_03G007591 [Glycine soja]